MRAGAWGAWLPVIAAVALAYVLDAHAMAFGALLGAASFAGLLIARRPVTFKFGMLSLAGAVAFGFIAAVLASLFGLPVSDLMTRSEPQHFGARVIGSVAVMLAVLGLASVVWARLTRQAEDDS